MSTTSNETPLRIGILGTGPMARAMAAAWAAAGHELLLAGRDPGKAAAVARETAGAGAVPIRELPDRSDVLLVAVAWEGLDGLLGELAQGPVSGMTVIDCTNAVDYARFAHRLGSGSAAELVAARLPGARVVKALHLFAGQSWLSPASAARQVVALCGDDRAALEQAADLVRALGGQPAVVGDLAASRQLEETAGFVMRVVAAGFDPSRAVPSIAPPPRED